MGGSAGIGFGGSLGWGLQCGVYANWGGDGSYQGISFSGGGGYSANSFLGGTSLTASGTVTFNGNDISFEWGINGAWSPPVKDTVFINAPAKTSDAIENILLHAEKVAPERVFTINNISDLAKITLPTGTKNIVVAGGHGGYKSVGGIFYNSLKKYKLNLSGINVYLSTCEQGAYESDWSKVLGGANVFGVTKLSYTNETMAFLRMIGSGCSPAFAWWWRRTK